MQIREWLNNNPAVMTVGAVVLLLVCLGLIMMQLTGGTTRSGPVDAYFFDTNEGKLFTAEAQEIPPTDAPSGARADGKRAGVRAYVFGCGSCPGNLDGLTAAEVEAKGAFVAYLEVYTPKAKATIDKAKQAQDPNASPESAMALDMAVMTAMDTGRMVRNLDTEKWYPAMSDGGMAVYSKTRDHCSGGDRPKQCFPGR